MSNNDLSQFSNEELQQELEKRSQAKNQRPQPLEVNAEEAIFILRRLMESIIDRTIEDGFWWSDNNPHLVFEKVGEILYGGRVFLDWKDDFPEEHHRGYPLAQRSS
jgi:hypothetical protein